LSRKSGRHQHFFNSKENRMNNSHQQWASPGPRSKGRFKHFRRLLPVIVLELGMVAGPGHALAQRPLGIDVSSYQTCVDWVSAKSSGRTFAWAKSDEGTYYPDPYFSMNMTNAQAAGVLIGAYHFARPDQNLGLAGADAEAAYFWSVVKKYIKNDGAHLQPALDLEQDPGSSYTKTTMSQWVNRWCQDIVNYAAASNIIVRPVIYTGAWWADPWLDTNVTQWPVWLANYNNQNPQTDGPNSTSVWSNWNVWQYSSTNLVTGVPGKCDENVFNGTSDELGVLLIIGGSNSTPIIGNQPANTSVATNGTTSFSVLAYGGLPLSYQWQKNSNNLANSGHYSGCTTNAMTITGADSSDVGSYRCVVTNVLGSKTSSNATLNLIVSCEPNALLNGSFEEGNNACGVATNWIPYQRQPVPGTTWSIQNAAPPAGAGSRYQQILNTSSTGGGGVRQDVTGCTVGATYRIAGWMRGNSASATCRITCSPTASASWATAIDLTPAQSYSGSTWTAFSGTVMATSAKMTIWLDGQTGGSELNKAECFDAVTVTCTAAPVPILFQSVTCPVQYQARLVLTGKSNRTVTIFRSSNLVNWATWTNLVNTNGTLQVTDKSATNVRTFYRASQP
jgi:GH25 family lysozyme M1 (1,4-beta-N-acetylmuramidase)